MLAASEALPPVQPGEPRTVQELEQEVAGLRDALTRRDIIGQAKGIIRVLMRTDADAAFALLSGLSQDTHRKIYDVATALVEASATGQPLPADLARSWHRRTDPLAIIEQAWKNQEAAGPSR